MLLGIYSRWNSRFVKGQSPLYCQPLVAAGEAIQTVAVLWTPLAVPWTLLAAVLNWASSLWQLPTWPPCILQLVAVHYSPPQSSWTVCVMDSSLTLLTWLYTPHEHIGVLVWEQTFPMHSCHCFLWHRFYDTVSTIATDLYSASCKEFYTVHFYKYRHFYLYNDSYGPLWQDKMAVWNVTLEGAAQDLYVRRMHGKS